MKFKHLFLLFFQNVSASCTGVFFMGNIIGHQLSSTASLSLSEPSSAAKFFKISLATVYNHDYINYAGTVLIKLHTSK